MSPNRSYNFPTTLIECSWSQQILRTLLIAHEVHCAYNLSCISQNPSEPVHNIPNPRNFTKIREKVRCTLFLITCTLLDHVTRWPVILFMCYKIVSINALNVQVKLTTCWKKFISSTLPERGWPSRSNIKRSNEANPPTAACDLPH